MDLTKFRGKINEVMVINATTLADESGKFPPWVEIYNNSDDPIDVGGAPLSDDLLQPKKWLIPRIPAAKLPARGFLVIFVDGAMKSSSDLHTNFTISPQEAFKMALNQGTDLFSFDTSTVGPDQSVGRYPDGRKVSVLSQPTPGQPNSKPAEAEFIRGDVNGDGAISILDTIMIQKVLAKQAAPPPCQDRMDLNDDGLVDQADVAFLMARLFQSGSPPPPPPYPAPGLDPTPDDLPCPRL